MKVGVTAALWLCLVLSPANAEPAELRAGGTGAATDLLRQLAGEFGKDVMAGAFVFRVCPPWGSRNP